jgi:N-acetylglucosaminyl-diphospho-decaprenol L-rhamnosyltransferase
MTISAVVVNWNAGRLLCDCVRSFIEDKQRCGIPDAEVIVVDNNSSDSSIASLKAAFPAVRIIQNTDNLGFARATNQGIRAGGGDYVLLLNPDTEVRPGALGALKRFLESQPLAGAVGPKLLNPDGSLQISAYPEPTLFREAWRLFHLDRLRSIGSYPMHSWGNSSPRDVDVLMGACILLPRKVLDECGLLDERFFIYSEDQDLCRRLKNRGWRIFWLPGAEVVHYGGQSTRQVKAEMFVRLYKEKIAYFRTHNGASSAAAYKTVLFCASLARQAASPLAFLAGSEKRQRTLETAKLYRRLVRELPAL